MSLILYSYFRSSAAYRVRIALNLKNLHYEIRPVHLLKDGGEQLKPDYLSMNPQGRVPTLVADGRILTQSAAIIEFLEETYPDPPLLPADALDRAYVRALAQIIACDIHSLNNLRVLKHLSGICRIEETSGWYCHWIEQGFDALQTLLQQHGKSGRFCMADTPGMADVFLIPQVYNAARFNCNMIRFPLIMHIYRNAMQESAFIEAAPENQPDAESP